ncbi:MAG: hypothetical protein J5830_04090, partial [Clostridia bacterium]|nr:hypothetical protein [Clostridia bacterium]
IYDVDGHVMFGTDSPAGDYQREYAAGLIRSDGEILDGLGVGESRREGLYRGALMRFLGVGSAADGA